MGSQQPNLEGDHTADWYVTPREKRQRVRNQKRAATTQCIEKSEQQNVPVKQAGRETSGNSTNKIEDKGRIFGLGVPLQPTPPKQSTIFQEESSSPTTAPKRKANPSFQSPHYIAQDALNAVASNVISSRDISLTPTHMETNDHAHFNIEHFCAPVIHPPTGKLISKYAEIANNPEIAKVWPTAFGKEFGELAQGDNKTGAKGTNSLIVITHDKIRNIPAD